jgi:hypothetical protein
MKRFVLGGCVLACGAVLLALAGGAGAAAPVPKDAGKNDPTPDLPAVFRAVEKAVDDKKWPSGDDERLLLGSARATFDRALRAAKQKGRGLPVDLAKLKKFGPGKEFKEQEVEGGLVIAGEVKSRNARDSVLFASGKLDITNATNCIIFAQNVHCVAVDNCLIVAGEGIELCSAWRPFDGDGSVLVAGRRIEAARMDGTVCHVLRVPAQPAPEESAEEIRPNKWAIHTDTAKGVIFLNDRADTQVRDGGEQTYLPQKNPIAK